jgi:hypothetical protein
MYNPAIACKIVKRLKASVDRKQGEVISEEWLVKSLVHLCLPGRGDSGKLALLCAIDVGFIRYIAEVVTLPSPDFGVFLLGLANQVREQHEKARESNNHSRWLKRLNNPGTIDITPLLREQTLP